jgi:hypothetical protein
MNRLAICREISKEMDTYEIDGYWYGRHESVITKVTVKNTSGNAIEDLAKEILRVACNGMKIYPKVWNEEYSASVWDESQPHIGMVRDWKYRNAIKNWIKEKRQKGSDQ